MPDRILTKLNPEQKKAVTHTDGPLLIIAGAGTGKTTCITRRIANLIVNKKIKPDEILALTFTDKAAYQMQEKVDVLVPYGFTDTWIYTFHAFGDRILRENALEIGITPDIRVLTRPQAAVLFRENLFKFPLKHYRPLGDPTRFVDALMSLFSRARDEDVSPEEYLEYAQGLAVQSVEDPDDDALKEESQRQMELAKCYQQYLDLLIREGKVDFANQFYLTLKLLREHPNILKKYQQQFKYILIDEFQDTNYAQFELVKLLAAGSNNLTVVADDDQSIYKWRGAAVSNILNFINIYPASEKIALTKNYRSTQTILDSAYQLIQHNNPDRFEVQAKINKRLTGRVKKGKAVKHMHFDTLSSEADWVAQQIHKKVKSKKFTYDDFAILVRSNSDADPFIRSLNMKGIPWQFSGNQGLYSKDEVKLCIAFLRVIANPADSLSLFYLATSVLYKAPILELTHVMNYAKRRQIDLYTILKKTEDVADFGQLSREFLNIKEKLLKDVEEFLQLSREHQTGKLLYLFLTQTGFIKSLAENQTLENESKIRNIANFFEIIKDFEYVTRENRVLYFISYLDMLINVGDDPAVAEAELDTPAVNILTIHKAKGLEFPVCFMVCLVERRFPWPLRRDPIELPAALIKDILPLGDFHIQEERRLFYVGMTRAESELYLTSAVDYGTKSPKKVSRFVADAVALHKDAKVIKTNALESLERNAPRPSIPFSTSYEVKQEDVLTLSYLQIDDYLTCPLKYKYVHLLRVPIMTHHTVQYGKALHDAVQVYHQNRMKGMPVNEDDVLEAFRNSFGKEGFLSKEHIDLRLRAGEKALHSFYWEQEKLGTNPKYIEKDFSFMLGNNRIIGRWDRVDEHDGATKVIDFKSSLIKQQKDADKRARESLQLSLYSVAYQKAFGHLPDYKELHFLDSGLIGSASVTEKDVEKVEKAVTTASQGIRTGGFRAKPNRYSCQYCAYNQICPAAVVSR